MSLIFIPKHFTNNYEIIKDNNYIRCNGYLMFADLSGFTAMSEKLSLKGNEGSEEISRILNEIFEDLISIIEVYSGSVYKFGGDALTVFFPESISSINIILCSSKILDVIEKKYKKVNTIAGIFRFEIKIGLAFGESIIGQVGVNDKAYFIAGDTLDHACEGEHIALKDEIVGHNSFYHIIDNKYIKSKRDNFAVIEYSQLKKNDFNTIKSVSYSKKLKKEEWINHFVDKIILEKISIGEIDKGELRKATILFMSFEGITYDLNFDYFKLNNFYITVSESVKRFGGYINKIDMGDKGSKIIILFGAPIATEKNEEFALRCAEDIRTRLEKGISIKIGLNSGEIYFGIIGSQTRMEFTVIGSSVNLSARLMTSCISNEILISDEIRNKVIEAKVSNERELKLKGIKNKFKVHSFESVAERRKSKRVKLIGKIKEQEEYRKIIERKFNHKLVVLNAEAGMGKSVLLNRFYEILVKKSKCIVINCLSYTQNNSYFVLKEIFNKILELEFDEKLEIKKERLKKVLLEVGEEEHLDIFSSFLDWEAFDSKSVAGDSLKDIFINITISIFSKLFTNKTDNSINTSLFIEDMQWIDSSSLDFIHLLLNIAESDNFLFHFTYRPDKRMIFIESKKYSKRFKLDKMEENESREFLVQKFNLEKIPENKFQKIYIKTRGNPFFMEEIMISLKNEGYLVPIVRDDRNEEVVKYKFKSTLKEIQIPDNLTEVILSRIDKLDANSKLILKIASVVGRVFQIDILKQLKELKEIAEKLELRDKLDNLNNLDLTLFEESSDNEYLFKHALTHDAVYETLLYSVRRVYHEKIAKIYEENLQGNLQNIYELLAYHFQRSKNIIKAKEFLLKSAIKAKNKFSYAESIKFLKEYRKKKYKLSNEELAESYFLEIDILKTLEKRDKGMKLCEKVKDLFDEFSYYYQKAIIHKTEFYRKAGKHNDAIAEIDTIEKYFSFVLEIEGKINQGYSYILTGNVKKQEYIVKYIENNTRAIKNKIKLKYLFALSEKFLAYYYLSKRDIEISLKKYNNLYKITKKNNFKSLTLQALQNIGVCYANLGNFTKAEKYFNLSYTEAKKIYNYEYIILSINNISRIASISGNYIKAEKLIHEGYELAYKFNKLEMLEIVLQTKSNILFEQKKFKEVLDVCSTRLVLSEENNDLKNRVYIRDIEGDANFQIGLEFKNKKEIEQAENMIIKSLDIYETNLKLARKLKNIEIEGHTYGNLANCYAELGDKVKCLKYYDKQVKYSEKHNDIQSKGKAYYNLAYTFFNDFGDNKKALSYCKHAKDIFEKIGFKQGLDATVNLIEDIESKN